MSLNHDTIRFVNKSNRIKCFGFYKLKCEYPNEIDQHTRFVKRLENYDLSDTLGPIGDSRLIESLVINIPIKVIPVLDICNRRFVLEGRKRLAALINFFQDDLTLQGLEYLKGFEGLSFQKLDDLTQTSFKKMAVPFVVLMLKDEDGFLKENSIEELSKHLMYVYKT